PAPPHPARPPPRPPPLPQRPRPTAPPLRIPRLLPGRPRRPRRPRRPHPPRSPPSAQTSLNQALVLALTASHDLERSSLLAPITGSDVLFSLRPTRPVTYPSAHFSNLPSTTDRLTSAPPP